MTSCYRFDPQHSRFTAQAFAAGLLSFFGHSPTFAVDDFAGTVTFVDDLIAKMQLELSVRAGVLLVAGDVKPTAYPEITFRAAATATDRLAPGHYRTALDGTLALHGITRPHRLRTELVMLQDGLRLKGETALRLSEFGIQPVTALGGTIRFQDEVQLAFDLGARPEAA